MKMPSTQPEWADYINGGDRGVIFAHRVRVTYPKRGDRFGKLSEFVMSLPEPSREQLWEDHLIDVARRMLETS